jgi:hypothetical protein
MHFPIEHLYEFMPIIVVTMAYSSQLHDFVHHARNNVRKVETSFGRGLAHCYQLPQWGPGQRYSGTRIYYVLP